jgi:hypothetical protein
MSAPRLADLEPVTAAIITAALAAEHAATNHKAGVVGDVPPAPVLPDGGRVGHHSGPARRRRGAAG